MVLKKYFYKNMGKKLTQKEFIEKSNFNHNNKYDYSNTIYINANTKVKIICKEHGEFEQRAYDHLTRGCIKCHYNGKKSNTIDFIKKSKEIHGDEYNYSLVKYIGCKKKVIIICKYHGEFLQTPNNHLNKQGCYRCKNNPQRSNLEFFIKKSKKIHGDKYNYSKSKYQNIRTDIIITCKKHGDFLQKPNKHIEGQGCMKCKIDNNTLTTEEFIKKSTDIHGNKYDYSKVEYKYTNKKVMILCKKHGEFLQTPMTHLRGTGCPECGGTIKQNTEYFINRANSIHNKKYDYSLVDYENQHKKVTILCKEHGKFKQTPNSHLNNSGCPKCGNKFGIMENMWLDSLNIEKRQFKIGKYFVDGYDPVTNTVYEFNGDFWHGNPNKYNLNDVNIINKKTFGELYENTLDKEKKLIELGYNVISIWETDYLRGEY
jgi:hypothetical protein